MVNMYLTPQERRVLEFVCNKNSDAKKAADFFCVSINTMKQHLHNIYSKCGVENMAELVRMYHTEGLKEFIEP